MDPLSRTPLGRAAVALALLLTSSVSVYGQQESGFENPGARSLGFGGAFVGLADDATAAFANPSGLVQLTDPEISIEGRLRGYAESSINYSSVGFLSFVYPSERWTLALYRHQLVSFDLSFVGGILGIPGFPQIPVRDGFVDLDVVVFGASGAFKVGEKLSLGFGLTYFDGSESIVASGGERHSEGQDGGIVVGFLYRLDERWKLGGIFRQGGDLDDRVTGSLEPDRPFSLADVYGLGAVFRSPSGAWTVSGEWDRVDGGDELHLGTEYAFLKKTPLLALRVGTWLESGRFGGDDESHFAVGFGATFRRIQLDLGADSSNSRDTVSVSAIYFF